MTDLADPTVSTVADIDAAAAALEAEFAGLDDWSARLKHLMDLGRALDGIPPHQRRDQDQVTGCQSQLWLVIERTPAGLRIRADSDALIMRGLLALVLRLYDGRPAAAILAHSPAVLDRLAVGRNLAPSRANGVHLIVKRIREAAAAA
ncbi:Cysteine desulfuration protein sufE [Nitrospirillum viridazoti Y2]|uniref:Cysteine desulfuration protein SufE n=1 Tax=Nitrospirillum amazonense TaxID=28077 RepID=A0A560IBV3_9PROT|nr:SufE family protein [Nitrospirillum amazonense]EGY02062.1 Cysteine desulfuration protein sufE [Nitrospirillum amazonense Y2]TWB56542.1 cysteine desulfuration protein SufE [Nitrospirillum amazonense]